MSSEFSGKLYEKVRNGAVLYMSMDGAVLSPFADIAGVHVLTRSRRHQKSERYLVVVNCEPYAQNTKLTLKPGWRTDRMLCYSDSALLDADIQTVRPNSGVILKIDKAE